MHHVRDRAPAPEVVEIAALRPCTGVTYLCTKMLLE